MSYPPHIPGASEATAPAFYTLPKALWKAGIITEAQATSLHITLLYCAETPQYPIIDQYDWLWQPLAYEDTPLAQYNPRGTE